MKLVSRARHASIVVSVRGLCVRTFPGLACCSIFAVASLHVQAQAQSSTTPAALNGAVTDKTNAGIPHATIHLHSDAADTEATTDASGRFTLTASPATYLLTVEAAGFSDYIRTAFVITPQNNAPLTIKLAIATATQEVNVGADAAASTDASSNKSALVFSGEKLDTFSDDPATMQQQLLALGGNDPTNPPQVYVDGFSNGTLPPRESIREIRINQNPFSAQYDQMGFGRIEIFTKPGANKLHGYLQGNFGDSSLNARNPYTGAQPAYDNQYLSGNINGPIGKSSSFFLSAQHNNIGTNTLVNAILLGPGAATTKPGTIPPTIAFSQAYSDPTTSQSYSARFDHQFGKSDTFIGKYIFSENQQTNVGVGQFALADQALTTDSRTQTLQLSDTHLFGAKIVLDSSFQYIRQRSRNDATSAAPALVVEGAFSSGGNSAQSVHDNEDRFEIQDYFSISHDKHFIRTGVRYRLLRDANFSTAGYAGQFTFPDITTYNDAHNGLNAAARTAAGDAAVQYTITTGNPHAAFTTGDIGIYAEDEYKRTPNLTLNYGFRIESQSAIPDHFDFAPRLGFAYAIVRKPADPNAKPKDPIATIRGGFGIFFRRFDSGNILTSIRENGISEQTYFIAAADTLTPPSLASLAATPSTTYSINPNLRAAYTMQAVISVDRSLGKLGNMNISYYQRRSIHQYESLNLNAPLPTTGIRPFGGTQNAYEFSSDGVSNGHTLSANINLDIFKKFSYWAYASVGHQESDVALNGGTSFASNSYNLAADAGTISGYAPRQLYTGINAHLGWDITGDIFVAARSSSNFNVTTGLDNNGDSIYNDRPAFATDLTRASVVRTAYGNFDTQPIPGQTIIPINYGKGPSLVYTELDLYKNFRFGTRPAPPVVPAVKGVVPAKPDAKTPTITAPITPVKDADLPPKPYRLSFGIEMDNALNHVNRGTPIGVLSSPFFGQSTNLNSNFTGNSAANRVITLHSAFSF